MAIDDLGDDLGDDSVGEIQTHHSPWGDLTKIPSRDTQGKPAQGQLSPASTSQDHAASRLSERGNDARLPWPPQDRDTDEPEEIPFDFGISPYNARWIAEQQSKGRFEDVDIELTLKTYIYHAQANEVRKSNWDKDFRQYLIRTEEYY